MICPHCGKDTPIQKSYCVNCQQSLLITAGQTVEVEREDEEFAYGEWGPKLLRAIVGLIILAVVLGYGTSFLKKRELTKSKIDTPSLPAPRPSLPTPQPPKTLPKAGLIEPVGVSIPPLPKIELAFGSRDAAVKKLFLKRNGGDDRTEAAVEKGLYWLKEVQEAQGHWSADKFGGNADKSLGVTGLALLAYLGAGYDHMTEGQYQETVSKALKYVLSKQREGGRFEARMYTQGICTMALIEAYGMTGDTTLLQQAQAAVRAIVEAQQDCGGWDYSHTRGSDRGDTSVTGWQVMALKSALQVGIEFPKDVMAKTRKFLRDITRADGAIGYTNKTAPDKPWRTTSALTAAGLNAHLFAKAKHDEDVVQKAVGVILRNMPQDPKEGDDGKWRPGADVYFWYHASLALSRIGGREWRVWNSHMKRLLLKLQGKDGSWEPHGDRWEKHGGKIYFTALSIMALEVYYRYD